MVVTAKSRGKFTMEKRVIFTAAFSYLSSLFILGHSCRLLVLLQLVFEARRICFHSFNCNVYLIHVRLKKLISLVDTHFYMYT